MVLFDKPLPCTPMHSHAPSHGFHCVAQGTTQGPCIFHGTQCPPRSPFQPPEHSHMPRAQPWALRAYPCHPQGLSTANGIPNAMARANPGHHQEVIQGPPSALQGTPKAQPRPTHSTSRAPPRAPPGTSECCSGNNFQKPKAAWYTIGLKLP